MPPALKLSLPPKISPPARPAAASWAGITSPGAAGVLAPNDGRKVLHLVRHAQGFHNVDGSVMRTEAGLDARLTPEGASQCAALQALTQSLRPELIVSSPLTRTLQTAQLSFGPQRALSRAPMIALESVRETVNFLCDARRDRSVLASEFTDVDFSGCPDDADPLWRRYEKVHGTQAEYSGHRESDDLPNIATRARSAFAWLAARPEKEIVIVSHQVQR